MAESVFSFDTIEYVEQTTKSGGSPKMAQYQARYIKSITVCH